MSLAPTLAEDGRPEPAVARAPVRRFGLDLLLLSLALGAALVFAAEGGAEMLVGGALGAVIGFKRAPWRNMRASAAVSGAFAGLFAGALFAGFFHNALSAALLS